MIHDIFDSKGRLYDRIISPDELKTVPNLVAWRYRPGMKPDHWPPGLSTDVIDGVPVYVATDPKRTILSPGDWVVTQGPSCAIMTDDEFRYFRRGVGINVLFE